MHKDGVTHICVSKVKLAKEAGLSITATQIAVRQLEEAGLLIDIPGDGARVTVFHMPPPGCTFDAAGNVVKRATEREA